MKLLPATLIFFLISISADVIAGPYNNIQEPGTWKTYRNDKYGYELKFPPDWEQGAETEDRLYKPEKGFSSIHEELESIYFTPTEYHVWPGKLSITIHPNRDHLTLAQWTKKYKEKTADTSDITNSRVDGREAKKVTIFAYDALLIETIVDHKTEIIVVEYEEKARDDVDAVKYMATCKKILSTFKLIE